MKKTLSLFSLILLMSMTFVLAQGSDSYEANLQDENCWTRINTCNLEENVTMMATVNGESQAILTVLKAANYQLQDDLNFCEQKVGAETFNKYVSYISLGLAVLVALWASYIVYVNKQKDKDDLRKKT